MKHKRVRFLIAVLVAAIVWMVVLIRTFIVTAWTFGQHGSMIPIYPHPVEIMLLTLGAVAVSAWLWRWYKRDRVQQALVQLDAEEKARLLQYLLVEQQSIPPASKRKRVPPEEAWQPEQEEQPDEFEDYKARRAASSG